ncbi:hypothetical protein LCGC14_1011330 [marine sediment metagenome]|uniref:Uncharacterized protein n=1 Tax=marine sediment metagenome TaxID=412755 RepID=A0A0F9N4P7_9ZZZZ
MISKELVQSLKNGAVLVIGDVMIDRYIEGDITRISPEASTEITDMLEKIEVNSNLVQRKIRLKQLIIKQPFITILTTFI